MIYATTESVNAYREKHNCSLYEAKQALLKQKLKAAVQDANTVRDLKEVLHYLIENL